MASFGEEEQQAAREGLTWPCLPHCCLLPRGRGSHPASLPVPDGGDRKLSLSLQGELNTGVGRGLVEEWAVTPSLSCLTPGLPTGCHALSD